MSGLRSWLYHCYWGIEQRVVPGLRSSQYAYYETLKRFTRKHPTWLDLGCGHQVFASWMDREQRDVVRDSRLVVGIDYDLPSLRKHQAIERRLAGEISRLPFPDETFDLVSANMVIEHLEDPAASLAEIRRVLKAGGAFVFHTPNYLSFWVFLSSIAPDFVKVRLACLLEGRPAADVFPARYRMNTPRAVREHASRAGFDIRDLQFVSTSAGTAVFGPLAAFELLLIRLLRRPSLGRFRTDLVGVLYKPAVAASRAA